MKIPRIRHGKCVCCDGCVGAFPKDPLGSGRSRYRVVPGGKLGRHPQPGRELKGIYSTEEVVALTERYIDQYMQHNIRGDRFADTLAHIPLGQGAEDDS